MIGAYAALLTLWVLFKPGSPGLYHAVEAGALFGGVLLSVALCFRGAALPWRRGGASAPAMRLWTPTLLGLGLASNALGEIVWFCQVLALHHPAAMPSWADVGYLGGYPFIGLGILLLPTQPLSLADRMRVLLGALMTMLALVTCSWYFVLGPTLLHGHGSALARAVGTAYPLCDLVLACCVVLLVARADDTAPRHAAWILALALGVIVSFDSVFDYLVLHGAYVPGGLVNVGWTIGLLLLGLGAYALRRADSSHAARNSSYAARSGLPTSITTVGTPSRLWSSLLPYTLVPAVGALLISVWHMDRQDSLELGVLAGAAALIALVLLRQVLTILENGRLYRRLNDAYALQSQDLAQRVADLEALLESASALNSTLDRDHILQALAAQLVNALGAANAAFTHVDLTARRCKSLVHYAAPGCVPHFSDDPWESLDDYAELEAVLRSHAPFYGNIDDPGFPANERAYLQRHGLRAELMVPLVVRGETAGVLEVHWDRPAAITADTLTLCAAIAGQAAVALENARLYADAATRAERDALTGLLNHRALLERLDAAASGGAPFALVLLDVDNFKLFNDTYGHLTGDAVLAQVAATLREVCRDGDVAGRYGGDEFAIVLHGASAAEARTALRRLSHAVRSRPHVTSDGAIIPLAISAGAATYPRDGRTRQELIAVADDDMYSAKHKAASVEAADDLNGGTYPEARLHDAADLLGDSPFGVLQGLVNAVDAKDRYTREHSEDVTQLALLLARELDLPQEQQRALAIAGLLHDVGKIAVPDRILRKPGRLTADEYETIKRHVTYGTAIIRGVLDDPVIVDAVACHHERWDGAGYPCGLKGAETSLLGRIMQIADAVSAMMLDRPYRQGLPWARVVSELLNGAGTQFDPDLVTSFVGAISRGEERSAS